MQQDWVASLTARQYYNPLAVEYLDLPLFEVKALLIRHTKGVAGRRHGQYVNAVAVGKTLQ